MKFETALIRTTAFTTHR